VALQEGFGSLCVAGDVVIKLAIDFAARFEEIDGAVLAVFVGACGGAGNVFGDGGAHGPHEGMNRAKNEDGSFFVPPGFAQGAAGVFRWARLEGPGGVRA
jgi:hypothetical protein